MELMILNSAFEKTGVIDTFESLIWTDRYYEGGDFELLTYPSSQILSILNQGYYAAIEESEHLMVIEDIHIKTDPVEGNKLVTKGRSLESILDRRIIWDPILFDTEPIQYSIYSLLTEHAINPINTARKINDLEFELSDDPVILSLKFSNQYWGENLYNSIVNICYSNNIGFKITFNENTGKYIFKLYAGVDRSYDQIENSYVIFSPNFENLKNSEYILSNRLLKTVALTAGAKGVGNAQICIEVDPSQGHILDLYRKEMFLDAQNTSTIDIYGNPINDQEYFSHLYQTGLEELSKNILLETFASEVDPVSEFEFGVDFFLGDVLQVSNEYGYEGKSRVIEVVRAQDGSGLKVYPIFRVVLDSQNIEESINLGKILTISCPKVISENINLGKTLKVILGLHEIVDFVIYSDLFANGRFD